MGSAPRAGATPAIQANSTASNGATRRIMTTPVLEVGPVRPKQSALATQFSRQYGRAKAYAYSADALSPQRRWQVKLNALHARFAQTRHIDVGGPISMMNLAFGLRFADLYSVDGASTVDRRFGEHLRSADAALAERLDRARASPEELNRKDEAALLIDVAPHLEDFIAKLFGIEAEVRALEARHHESAPLFSVRRQFVQRKAMNAHKAEAAALFDGPALRAALEPLLGGPGGVQAFELAFAEAATRRQANEA